MEIQDAGASRRLPKRSPAGTPREIAMSENLHDDIEELLALIAAGNAEAKNQLFELVYQEIREIAHFLMKNERKNHTLPPTALAHEAWIRITRSKNFPAKNRRFFFGAVRLAMRRILWRALPQPLTDLNGFPKRFEDVSNLDVMALEEALEKLELLDCRKCAVVEYRFFVGLSMKEIAKQLDVCLATVEKDWKFSRAWLFDQLGGEE
jgi:RNA polymerase sigma factor (TIGR02999 family)